MKENREYIPQELQELFIPYELAWKLQHYNSKEEEVKKRALFNTECIAFWNHYQEVHFNHTYDKYADHLKAPMYQQVVDWFIEKHNIHPCYGSNHSGWYWSITKTNGTTIKEQSDYNYFKTHYEALTKAIMESLKLI